VVEHVTDEPNEEPVSLEEAKEQMALEGTEDDDFVSRLISAARRHVESHCNRGIMQQTWEAVLDGFPHHGHHLYQRHTCGLYGGFPVLPCRACELFIELPHGQLATLDSDPSVSSVTYVDVNGNTQTLATSEYVIDSVNVPGRIHRAPNKQWPATRRQWDAVKISYVVGWGIDYVPEPIKQAIVLLVSQMYEHRTPEVESRAITPVLFSYEALLSPYRLLHF
jgi:hypothetical protein